MSIVNIMELRNDRAVLLKNITCVYCGNRIHARECSKEHVIGRRFVPRGSLNRSWNLIVKTCKVCNEAKAKLEDDISAISLHGNLWTSPDDVDSSLMDEIKRKSTKCFSKMTRRLVAESSCQLKVEIPFADNVSLTIDLVSPPQIDNSRLFELARMQMMAFFYFLTYNHEVRTGGFWPEGFHPLLAIHKGDWGHPVHVAFMNSIARWEPRWIGCGAEGYYKSIIRRHPNETCWAWALEWNKYYRLIGFFGERAPAQALVNTFPNPEMNIVYACDNEHIRLRREEKLDEKDDVLFHWEPERQASGDRCGSE